MNIIKNKIDIFTISETKIDNSFPVSRFTMTVYSILFRLDQTSGMEYGGEGVEYFCLSEKIFLVK